MLLGDMTVVGDAPPKLLKALAVVADTLHHEFACDPDMEHPDKSKESCVLCSLTVRDFLRSIGFVNACVRPVVAVLAAWQGGQILHSVGIGVPGTKPRARYWNGHMVAWVPGSRTLVDTTLYTARRPQWPSLPPMLAVACNGQEAKGDNFLGLRSIIEVSLTQDDLPNYEFGISYLDNPSNGSWRRGPDARDVLRRRAVVATMRRKFGVWHG